MLQGFGVPLEFEFGLVGTLAVLLQRLALPPPRVLLLTKALLKMFAEQRISESPDEKASILGEVLGHGKPAYVDSARRCSF